MVGLFGLFLPAIAQILLFASVFLLDVFVSTAPFYYFSQHDLISSAKYVTDLPWQRTAIISLTLLSASLGLAALAVRTTGTMSHRNRRSAATVLLSLLLALSGYKVASRLRDTVPNLPLANSNGRTLVAAAWHREFLAEAAGRITVVSSATGPLFDRVRNHPLPVSTSSQQPNIVLVLAESYGLMLDAQGAAKLEAPYHSPLVSDRYDVQIGRIEFGGATVSGEFRELCAVQGSISSVYQARAISAECLPDLLKMEGYETTAIHGFLGAMFDRKTWYRDLGFDNVEFLENLRARPGIETCGGSVPGICDTDIAHIIRHDLSSNASGRPQFYYWVTLNSHLPIAIVKENSALLACGTAQAANPDPSVCNWMALIYKLNSAIAELSVDPELPPTELIVVGDHAPPFLTSAHRGQFSQHVVPFVRLVPRSGRATPHSVALNIHLAP